MVSPLERSLGKLTKANLEQSIVSKQIRQTDKSDQVVSVFDGDPCNILCRSAFNAQVDSRPLVGDIKLNILHQYVQGKPQQVVIGTEDRKPVLYCRKGLETVMLWVQRLLTNKRNGLR